MSFKWETFPSLSKKAAVPAVSAEGPEADKLHKHYAPFLSFAGKFYLVKSSKLK